MRTIIVGVGAIGGVVAAALTRSGQEAIGIARGPMLDAIRDKGLRFRAPGIVEVVGFDCVAEASEIKFRPDDMIILCVKTQHSEAALLSLRAAGVGDQPIFCMQNGVSNEPIALRYFPNIHGIAVRMPCAYTTPGEVSLFIGPAFGVLDIGRFPGGLDEADEAMVASLNNANFDCVADKDVMDSKRGKLLGNINNILDAAMAPGSDSKPWRDAMRAEAVAVYEAADLNWSDFGKDYPERQELLKMREVEGAPRSGGSTYQSLERGTGNLETDFLNGEIVQLGRLFGVPTPVNAAICKMAVKLAANGANPGSLSVSDLPSL